MKGWKMFVVRSRLKSLLELSQVQLAENWKWWLIIGLIVSGAFLAFLLYFIVISWLHSFSPCYPVFAVSLLTIILLCRSDVIRLVKAVFNVLVSVRAQINRTKIRWRGS